MTAAPQLTDTMRDTLTRLARDGYAFAGWSTWSALKRRGLVTANTAPKDMTKGVWCHYMLTGAGRAEIVDVPQETVCGNRWKYGKDTCARMAGHIGPHRNTEALEAWSFQWFDNEGSPAEEACTEEGGRLVPVDPETDAASEIETAAAVTTESEFIAFVVALVGRKVKGQLLAATVGDYNIEIAGAAGTFRITVSGGPLGKWARRQGTSKRNVASVAATLYAEMNRDAEGTVTPEAEAAKAGATEQDILAPAV